MQQKYSVSLTLPLSLPATSLAEAQTQADALMTGSNATGALAAALSAGLISGRALQFDVHLPQQFFLLYIVVFRVVSSLANCALRMGE